MNYRETMEHSLKVRWKTRVCNSGEDCWCRIIEPETILLDEDGDEVYIAGSGSVDKVHAEYIVELHNKSLE